MKKSKSLEWSRVGKGLFVRYDGQDWDVLIVQRVSDKDASKIKNKKTPSKKRLLENYNNKEIPQGDEDYYKLRLVSVLEEEVKGKVEENIRKKIGEIAKKKVGEGEVKVKRENEAREILEGMKVIEDIKEIKIL